jgi:hypothetical protein
MVQFQSTLTYLKTPPSGYANQGVDLVGGLDDINRKAGNGDYDNEYDFESDIAALLVKSYDGHLGFDGMAFRGVFGWRRSRQISLISGSSDGKETPKVWAVQDYNNTDDGTTRSAVTQINGKDAVQFLEEEAAMLAYHDADVRYNAMLYQLAGENAGGFANPAFYPGPNTEVRFENGSTETYVNTALVLDSSSWLSVSDSDDFYRTFIRISSDEFKKKREEPYSLPRRLQLHRKSGVDDEAVVPLNYPEPTVEHSASDVPLAGYFIDTDVGQVGVLTIGTFNTDTVDNAEEFQSVIEEFIAEAKSRNVARVVVDVRSNGGGLVMLGYDAYLQFFPTQEPQLQSRFRANDATNLLGSQLSTLELNTRTVDYYSTPFNFHAYLDQELKPFTSWENMYGPTNFNSDSFTHLLRYNLSDPLVTSSDRFSVGITMTGYGNRANFNSDPFKPEDIIILSDGICASTCALFTELMVQQSGVRTLAVGGRPRLGPMQAVGGTKGSLVLSIPLLHALSQYVIQMFASTTSEADDWINTLPIYQESSINFVDGGINFQDNIRKGLEKDGVPTQFLNDTASCRIFYKPEEYVEVEKLWARAANVAFGKDGGLDEQACVAGSITSREAQTGVGEGSPTSPQGGQPSRSKAAAAGVRPVEGGWTVLVGCAAVVLSSVGFGASLI